MTHKKTPDRIVDQAFSAQQKLVRVFIFPPGNKTQ